MELVGEGDLEGEMDIWSSGESGVRTPNMTEVRRPRNISRLEFSPVMVGFGSIERGKDWVASVIEVWMEEGN